MASNVSSLPEDIIGCILGELGFTDAISLRLVCKSLYRKTTYYFGRSYFNTLSTDLSFNSLKSIGRLSQNADLVCHVKILRIKIAPEGVWLGRGFYWSRHPKGHLLHPTENVHVLQALLITRLVNCRSFHIYSEIDDGGISRENHCSEDMIMPSDAVCIMLTMIAEANMTMEAFRINFTTTGIGRIDARRVVMPRSLVCRFEKAWSRLRELSIEQTLTPESFHETL